MGAEFPNALSLYYKYMKNATTFAKKLDRASSTTVVHLATL